MLINCVLRTWFKEKEKPEDLFYEVPIYLINHYTDNPLYDVKWALQIVALDSEGDIGMVLVEKVIVPDGKSIHHIHYWSANYSYDEAKNIIYTTQTQREI